MILDNNSNRLQTTLYVIKKKININFKFNAIAHGLYTIKCHMVTKIFLSVYFFNCLNKLSNFDLSPLYGST